MATGKVKWFNNAKGYGFILADDDDEDLFAHFSSITMEGYKTLKAGQPVTFDIIEGPKGMHAVNINSIGGDELASPSQDPAQDPAQDQDAQDNVGNSIEEPHLTTDD